MKFIETPIKDLYVIELEPRIDERGFFVRAFAQDELKKVGLEFDIVQANQSFTKKKGTIRGMHCQLSPKMDGKILQCLEGKVYDVSIDLRKDSPTYKKWFGIELANGDNKMIFSPKGFAHGLQTLTDNCRIQYFMSEFYTPEYYSGVRYDDPAFNIKWPIPIGFVSDQDKSWPLM